jgi:hypothetical protein
MVMEPAVLSEHLKKLAGLIDRSEAPSGKAVRAELTALVASLEGRQAAKLKKFMDKDFELALDGIDNLIKQLSKTSQTLNPQDEGKADIESSLTELHKLRSGIQKTVEGLGSVNV